MFLFSPIHNFPPGTKSWWIGTREFPRYKPHSFKINPTIRFPSTFGFAISIFQVPERPLPFNNSRNQILFSGNQVSEFLLPFNHLYPGMFGSRSSWSSGRYISTFRFPKDMHICQKELQEGRQLTSTLLHVLLHNTFLEQVHSARSSCTADARFLNGFENGPNLTENKIEFVLLTTWDGNSIFSSASRARPSSQKLPLNGLTEWNFLRNKEKAYQNWE